MPCSYLSLGFFYSAPDCLCAWLRTAEASLRCIEFCSAAPRGFFIVAAVVVWILVCVHTSCRISLLVKLSLFGDSLTAFARAARMEAPDWLLVFGFFFFLSFFLDGYSTYIQLLLAVACRARYPCFGTGNHGALYLHSCACMIDMSGFVVLIVVFCFRHVPTYYRVPLTAATCITYYSTYVHTPYILCMHTSTSNAYSVRSIYTLYSTYYFAISTLYP